MLLKIPRVWYGLGMIYVKKNDSQKAIEAFSNAITFNDKYIEARWELAKIYERINYKQQAYDNYKKIIQIDPNNSLKDVILQKLEQFRNEGIVDDEPGVK